LPEVLKIRIPLVIAMVRKKVAIIVMAMVFGVDLNEMVESMDLWF
jgi:hypothetical protein